MMDQGFFFGLVAGVALCMVYATGHNAGFFPRITFSSLAFFCRRFFAAVRTLLYIIQIMRIYDWPNVH